MIRYSLGFVTCYVTTYKENPKNASTLLYLSPPTFMLASSIKTSLLVPPLLIWNKKNIKIRLYKRNMKGNKDPSEHVILLA